MPPTDAPGEATPGRAGLQRDEGSPLGIQFRIVGALMVRDLMVRYGRDNIGFFWVVLEPMLLTAAVLAAWSMIRAPYEHGVALVAIVLTGYMPLTLWRHMTGPFPQFLRRNFDLMFHRNVTPLDLLFSRLALEFAGTTGAFFVVYGTLLTLGVVEPFHDIGTALAGWFLMGGMATGTALIIAAGSEYSEVVERYIGPIQYLLVPISGAFFMVEWLPKRAQDMIFYVPLTHAYEAFRAGYFGPTVVTHYSFAYAVPWALGLMGLGFVLVVAVQDRIHR